MPAKKQTTPKFAFEQPHPLHPTRLDALLVALRTGSYIEPAAEYARLGARTVHRYISEGRDIEARIAEHDYDETAANLNKTEQAKWQAWQSIKDAMAAAEIRALARINKAADDGTWQAAAWLLERRSPDRWGRHDRQTITAQQTVTVTPERAKELLDKFPDDSFDKHSGK